MEARELIAKSAYGPDQLKILFMAFDEAWDMIAADVDDRPEAIQAARLKLANLLLTLALDRLDDAEWLRDSALNIMRATLGRDKSV
jgi:hypothetical protein